jgi:hypothetical protein
MDAKDVAGIGFTVIAIIVVAVIIIVLLKAVKPLI